MLRRYLKATFSSLRSLNYRIYVAGQLVSVTGAWMQKVSQAWLVLELTNSGTLLGVTTALQQLPTLLLTPWGGALADRLDKRKVLICTQFAAALPALLLGTLIAKHAVSIWVVFVMALVSGCIEALDRPSRLTFVSEIAGREHLTNAVTLNSVVQNVGKVVGPGIAGILISSVGLTWSFLANGLSFFAVIAGLLVMKVEHRAQRLPAKKRARGDVRAGLRYVMSHRDLAVPVALMALTGLVAYNWTIFLTLLARDTFHGDGQAVGLTFTMMGVGAIVGGLGLAGTMTATSARLAVNGVVLAAVIVAIGVSPTLPVALVLMVVLGASSVAFRAVASSLLQLRSSPDMRGRVISLFVIATGGTTPIGGPVMGWVCQQFGARAGFVSAGVITGMGAIIAVRYSRRRAAPADDTADPDDPDEAAGDALTSRRSLGLGKPPRA